MKARPDLDLDLTADALHRAYGIRVRNIAFLPLGADPEAAAWRVEPVDGPPYFLKTRHGPFDRSGLAVARWMNEAGIAEVLAPLRSSAGDLCVDLGGVALILYPFADGESGFDVALNRRSWTALGAALRRVHAATIPAAVAQLVPVETFCPEWRDRVRAVLDHMPTAAGRDPIASELLALLAAQRNDVERILLRARDLAATIRRALSPFVLCHTDLHAGNVLVAPDGTVRIIDWDAPKFAPKERDLMFIGGGVGGSWNAPWEAEAFYDGYGPTDIDPVALAYYRYERIVEDIAVTCEQILTGKGENRAESLDQLQMQWRPGDVIEIADATYDRLIEGRPA